jgi:hypothetical protein
LAKTSGKNGPMLDVDFHPEVMAQGTRGLQPLGCISNPQPVKNGEVKQAKKNKMGFNRCFKQTLSFFR